MSRKKLWMVGIFALLSAASCKGTPKPDKQPVPAATAPVPAQLAPTASAQPAQVAVSLATFKKDVLISCLEAVTTPEKAAALVAPKGESGTKVVKLSQTCTSLGSTVLATCTTPRITMYYYEAKSSADGLEMSDCVSEGGKWSKDSGRKARNERLHQAVDAFRSEE